MPRSFRRPLARPFGGSGVGTPRLTTTLMMLVVVGLVYFQMRDARNWRWLEAADDNDAPQAVKPAKEKEVASQWKETRITAPNDQNEEEHAVGLMQLDALLDKSAVQDVEMPAYWRLLKWSRSQSFEKLDERARRDVVFAQLAQRPEQFRGKLLRLRLHIRRIMRHDEVKENSAEASRVFELWGFTDESKSYPYSVVVPEIPAWFKTGGEVEEECVFVGYFFKMLPYEAFDKTRLAPLLIGRLRPVNAPPKKKAAAAAGNSPVEIAIVSAIFALVGFGVWRALPSRRAARTIAATEDDAVETWLRDGTETASQRQEALSTTQDVPMKGTVDAPKL